MMIAMDLEAAHWFLLKTLLLKTMNENAERINGLAAMLGIVAAMGAYAVTGQLIPGIFWWKQRSLRLAPSLGLSSWVSQ